MINNILICSHTTDNLPHSTFISFTVFQNLTLHKHGYKKFVSLKHKICPNLPVWHTGVESDTLRSDVSWSVFSVVWAYLPQHLNSTSPVTTTLPSCLTISISQYPLTVSQTGPEYPNTHWPVAIASLCLSQLPASLYYIPQLVVSTHDPRQRTQPTHWALGGK